MSENIFVATLQAEDFNKLKVDLENQGFAISSSPPPYALFAAKKKGVSCTLYNSGKLVVQGGEIGPFIEFYLEPEILHDLPFTYGKQREQPEDPSSHSIITCPYIGVDESGKGDFFGPLCVAAVFVDKEILTWLTEQKVRDSKLLSAPLIAKITPKIRAKVPHYIVTITPSKYNDLYHQFANLNTLLAWAHATAIENLTAQTHCKNVLIDQFAHESVVIAALKKKKVDVMLVQRHRGEEDKAVAAASMLARSAFVEGLASLEKRFDIILPKGAAAPVIAAGKQFVSLYGFDALKEVAKLHFKTTSSLTP